MAKLVYIVSALMVIQMCIEAAPNTHVATNTESSNNDQLEEADPKLDNVPYEAGKDTNAENTQGQRHKRFYNYFSFGFSPYDIFNSQFVKRDQSQDTGVYGAEDLYSQIYKRVQDILYVTKQQAFTPPRFSPPQIFYVPYACDCTPGDNERPSDNEYPNDVPQAPDTTSTTQPTINTAQTQSPASDTVFDTPAPTDQTNNTTPDLFTRFQESDEEDGSRPISFEPIKPDQPLSKPPPPVDHGINQASASNDNDLAGEAPSTTVPPPPVNGVAAQPDLPTNSIPTLCDGAMLTCCHRPDPVTLSCFEMQGCPDPMPANDPCDADAILATIRKFQYYYANRRG